MYGYIPGHGWDIFHSEPSFMAARYVSMVQFYSVRTSTLKNYNPNFAFRVIVKQALLYESTALELSLKCHNVDSKVRTIN